MPHALSANTGKTPLGIVIDNPAQSWPNSPGIFSLIFMTQICWGFRPYINICIKLTDV